ncbi:N-acetylglucosamine kinase [Geochorda subterranea]|uniref:BadF/BadG/BcrA/BcrD ATPase family protein n=1 Tax=Geochorda subterranea TaxID=3109564 RepID=A0ABZ1BQN1_9FIRM|nr:BadF/BadG/BcrA/BcrD ATPase family protein [Limnochorda sp. LNt]WRP15122.1 BadF/BadG/BcrA/BcrD ATPase family protein [Limnochorda sp. LNt]
MAREDGGGRTASQVLTSDDLVAGFDAGGTRTVCRIGTVAGQLVGEGEAGPGNHRAVGIERARAALEASFRRAWAAGRPEPAVAGGPTGEGPPLAAAFIALAGYEETDSQASLEPLWRGWLPARQVRADTDALAAWAAATGGCPGAVVVAGTGSMVLVIEGSGRRTVVGGWGHLLGDEGSAYDIAVRAIRRAIAAAEGWGPPSSLEGVVLACTGLPELRRLIGWIYDDPGEAKRRIASIAPAVVAAAREGDREALQLLSDAALELARATAAALRRSGLPTDAPVAVCGGLAREALYVQLLQSHLAALRPGQRVEALRQPPVEGAVLLARALAGAVDLPGALKRALT